MKKTHKYLSCIALLLVPVLMSTTSGDDCAKSLDLVMGYWDSQTTGQSYYLRYTTQNQYDQDLGQVVHTQYWQEGNRCKLVNEYLEIYNDEETLVRVMKNSKTIFVNRIGTKSAKATSQASGMAMIDSLSKMACAVSCSKDKQLGRIVLEFNEESLRKGIKVQRVFIEYKLLTGEPFRSEYTYFPDAGGTVQKDLYEFQSISRKLPPGMFGGSAFSQVMQGASPRAAYQNYTIQDLRTLPKEFQQ